MKYKIICVSMALVATSLITSCFSVTRGTATVSYNSEKGTILVSLDKMTSCEFMIKINEFEIGR